MLQCAPSRELPAELLRVSASRMKGKPKKRKAEQHRVSSTDKRRKGLDTGNADYASHFTRATGLRNGSCTYGRSPISSSITIHASQCARRVNAPNHRAIPTPGFRLVSDFDDERECSPEKFPDTFYAWGSFVSGPEPTVDRAQRQKEIFSDLMKDLGFSLRSVLQGMWDTLNTQPGLRLQVSELSMLHFTGNVELMKRSLVLGRKFVLLASHEILIRRRKRSLEEAGIRNEARMQKTRQVQDLLDIEFDEPSSSDDAMESAEVQRGGAKCWSGWISESARRASEKYWRSRPAPRQKKKPVARKRRKVRRRKVVVTDSEDEHEQEEEEEQDQEDVEWNREQEEVGWTRQKSVCKSVGKIAFTRILDRGCVCNVLFIEFDRGWREYGGSVDLSSGSRGKGCALSVLLMGETLFTQEVRDSSVQFSTNEFTGAYMWKGDKNWMLEFKHCSQFVAFKRLHEECFENNYNATVRSIKSQKSRMHLTIPKFRAVRGQDTRWRGPAFIRPPSKYIVAGENDSEHQVLYDMDSEDEAWLAKINGRAGMYKQKIPEQKFEKVIYNLEKYSHARNELLVSPDAATEVCLHVASLKIIKVIHRYWLKKRQEKGASLVRHFQLQPELLQKRPATSTTESPDESVNLVVALDMGTPPDSGLTAVTPEQEQQGGDLNEDHNFDTDGADGTSSAEPEQLVFKKFTGRASAQEQKRLRVLKQLQQAGIKHFRRAMPPVHKSSSSSNAGKAADENGELHALADAAILRCNSPSREMRSRASTASPPREDSEATATAASLPNDQEADSAAGLLSGLKKVIAVDSDNERMSSPQVTAPGSPPVEDRVVTSRRLSRSRKQQTSAESSQVEELEEPASTGKVIGALGIVLRPRKNKPQEEEAQEPRKRKHTGSCSSNSSRKNKKHKSWSIEIRRAMDKLRKWRQQNGQELEENQDRQQKQKQKQKQKQQQKLPKKNDGPLSIKRIPRKNSRFSTLLMVVAKSSKKNSR